MPTREDRSRLSDVGRLDRRALLLGMVGVPLMGQATRAARAQEDPAWQELPEMPQPRSELAAAVVGEVIYVVGGFGGGTRLDAFDTVGETWTQLADLPAELNHLGVAGLDGLVYVAGGFDRSLFAVDTLFAYDPASDAWSERAALPAPRGALGLVALDGLLYAVGGTTEGLGGPVSGAVEAYDPAGDAWTAVTTMPTPREHLAVAAGGGRIWTAGGRVRGDDAAPLAATAEAYEPAADRWETLPPVPTARGGVAGAWVADRLVTLGGETIYAPEAPLVHDAVEAFDPSGGTWGALPPLPIPRHGLAAVGLGDTLYAIAGGTIAGSADAPSGAIEALTLA
jgi:hypothetical protein